MLQYQQNLRTMPGRLAVSGRQTAKTGNSPTGVGESDRRQKLTLEDTPPQWQATAGGVDDLPHERQLAYFRVCDTSTGANNIPFRAVVQEHLRLTSVAGVGCALVS